VTPAEFFLSLARLSQGDKSPTNNEIADDDSHDNLLALSRQDELDLLLQKIKAKKNVTAVSDR